VSILAACGHSRNEVMGWDVSSGIDDAVSPFTSSSSLPVNLLLPPPPLVLAFLGITLRCLIYFVLTMLEPREEAANTEIFLLCMEWK
jgi:hypothetical protein